MKDPLREYDSDETLPKRVLPNLHKPWAVEYHIQLGIRDEWVVIRRYRAQARMDMALKQFAKHAGPEKYRPSPNNPKAKP